MYRTTSLLCSLAVSKFNVKSMNNRRHHISYISCSVISILKQTLRNGSKNLLTANKVHRICNTSVTAARRTRALCTQFATSTVEFSCLPVDCRSPFLDFVSSIYGSFVIFLTQINKGSFLFNPLYCNSAE